MHNKDADTDFLKDTLLPLAPSHQGFDLCKDDDLLAWLAMDVTSLSADGPLETPSDQDGDILDSHRSAHHGGEKDSDNHIFDDDDNVFVNSKAIFSFDDTRDPFCREDDTAELWLDDINHGAPTLESQFLVHDSDDTDYTIFSGGGRHIIDCVAYITPGSSSEMDKTTHPFSEMRHDDDTFSSPPMVFRAKDIDGLEVQRKTGNFCDCSVIRRLRDGDPHTFTRFADDDFLAFRDDSDMDLELTGAAERRSAWPTTCLEIDHERFALEMDIFRPLSPGLLLLE
ncbi:hypothetical protein HGRIS_005824 [Hohenbuehelia grisea]|uniref:Uncharacterized protein n=1 Tax=Hohenbuehelia grisea TaxID=104357 RepID=A0ABR3K097_9AGAR